MFWSCQLFSFLLLAIDLFEEYYAKLSGEKKFWKCKTLNLVEFFPFDIHHSKRMQNVYKNKYFESKIIYLGLGYSIMSNKYVIYNENTFQMKYLLQVWLFSLTYPICIKQIVHNVHIIYEGTGKTLSICKSVDVHFILLRKTSDNCNYWQKHTSFDISVPHYHS